MHHVMERKGLCWVGPKSKTRPEVTVVSQKKRLSLPGCLYLTINMVLSRKYIWAQWGYIRTISGQSAGCLRQEVLMPTPWYIYCRAVHCVQQHSSSTAHISSAKLEAKPCQLQDKKKAGSMSMIIWTIRRQFSTSYGGSIHLTRRSQTTHMVKYCHDLYISLRVSIVETPHWERSGPS